MANKFTRFLTDVFSGLSNPRGIVGNQQHATRLFIDDTMRLAPKTKFNYYVRFELDSSANKATNFTSKHINEFGLLIKTCDLPKFSFDMETLNEYNRKHIIYKMLNYDDVNMTFHDDNQGVVSALWAVYYGYYVRDRHNVAAAYTNKTQYRPAIGEGVNHFRYGLDNDVSTPLFKSITIYTMGRRRFIGYTLVNPKIKSWDHGQMDYSASSEPAESSMSISYEAVLYSAGRVSEGSPKGFATLHYDNTPSPLTVAGGGISNIFGEGGVLDGLEQVFGAVESGEAFGSGQGFLGTAIKAVNTFKNIKGLSKDGLKAEAINILTSPAGTTAIANTISGIAGTVFPKNDKQNEDTPATAKNLTIPNPPR